MRIRMKPITKLRAGLAIGCAFIAFSGYSKPSQPKKTLIVAEAFRFSDKFNQRNIAANVSGIEAAKLVFEQEHPDASIDLRKYSHDSDLASVITTAKQIITEKVVAVIGGQKSDEAMAMGDVFAGQGIILMSPTASNPSVTENKPFVFTACFSDRQVAASLAKFTANTLKPKVLGIVRAISLPYTNYLSRQFKTSFEGLMSLRPVDQRVPIIDREIIVNMTDFSDIIRDFKKAGVTHVSILTHDTDFTRFVTQSSDQSFFPIFIGSDGWGPNEKVVQEIVNRPKDGKAFVGYRTYYSRDGLDTKQVKKFSSAYKSATGSEPNAWGAVGFDAAYALFTAMYQAKDPTNGDEIRRRLEVLKIPAASSEELAYSNSNTPKKDLYLYKIDRTGAHYDTAL